MPPFYSYDVWFTVFVLQLRCLCLSLQTVNDFRAQYYTTFRNSSEGASTDDEDNNLVVRSFTDDPEIPLRQIRVRGTPTIIMCDYTNMLWVHLSQSGGALGTVVSLVEMYNVVVSNVWVG